MRTTLSGFIIALLVMGCETTTGLVSVIDSLEKQQLVIVSMGDSAASGEGNPEVTLVDNPNGALWQGDARFPDLCHSSTHSFHHVAAHRVIDGWEPAEHTMFRSLACSGAKIQAGLLQTQHPDFSQIVDNGSGPVSLVQHPQLVELNQWVDSNSVYRVDVVIVNIGINDIKFSKIVEQCASPVKQSCAIHPPTQVDLNTRLGVLESEYLQFLNLLNDQINPKHILVVGYPDPTKGNGNYCDRWSEGFTVGPDMTANGALQPGTTLPMGFNLDVGASTDQVTATETQWAYNQVLIRLNNTISNVAAQVPNARFVNVLATTKDHGICAEHLEAIDGTNVTKIVPDRWFLTFKDSWQLQGDFMGPLHPNIEGHLAMADVLEQAIEAVLEQND